MIIGKRLFTESDQDIFSQFSGDKNPIHLDANEARKTVSGECIVHGIHAILWMFECFIGRQNYFFNCFDISFLHFIRINEIVFCNFDIKNNCITLTNEENIILIQIKCTEQISNTKLEKNSGLLNFNNQIDLPKKLEINDIVEGENIDKFYGGKEKYGRVLFSKLINKINSNIIFEIALLSNLVGMQIPGLNSLLYECKISFSETNKYQSCNIKTIDKRFKFVKLKYQGINFNSLITAFFRPTSKPILKCHEIKRTKESNIKLSGKKALIIGGSRGIGAWVAKILAINAIDVTITYKSGKLEAEEILNDISCENKNNCNLVELDITKVDDYKKLIHRYDYFYYFATPKIFVKKSSEFDSKLFEHFNLFYCNAFKTISELLIKNGVRKILFPSTVAIDKPIIELKEYIEAKKNGEKTCDYLKNKYKIEVFNPRIDRVLTDQTTSVMPVNSEEPLNIAINLVNLMK